MKMELNAKSYNKINELTTILTKKLERLEKHFSKEMESKIILKPVKGDNFDIEITLWQKGMPVPVRSQMVTNNVNEAIDILLKKLEKQIAKFRERQASKKKVRVELPKIIDIPEAEKEKFGKVVRVKNYSISIISVEDAIEEMELLDHNFYIFVNAEDNKVSVIYKRNDNDYGLITPEY